MIEPNCSNCKFATPAFANTRQIQLVLCKRYPPVIIQTDTGMQLEYSAWPTIMADACCGEWASGDSA